MSLKDQIKLTVGPTGEKIHVPGWDVTVEVRPLSVRGRAQVYEKAMDDGEVSVEKLYPALILATVYDPDTNEPVFVESDIEWLDNQPAGVIDTMADAAMRLSGLTQAALESGKVDSTTPSVPITST